METIHISKNTDSFYIARWLYLKHQITQKELAEFSNKTKEELITILNDFGFRVKISGEKKTIFEPSESTLFD